MALVQTNIGVVQAGKGDGWPDLRQRISSLSKHSRAEPITVVGPSIGRDWTYIADSSAAMQAVLVAPQLAEREYTTVAASRRAAIR